MVRAGVFIGVDKTGNLDKLNEAASGAERMHAWALSQGMVDKTQAVLITDKDGGKVTVDRVYDAISRIVGGAGVDQLIVYFAGHGISINMSEHWLLSDAPVKRSAAIDVRLNAELAKECAAQHVVFISDACRVPPEGLQAQRVQGIEIFPNSPTGVPAKPVDQFFACRLGMSASELPTPTDAATAYEALYTAALLDALEGKRSELFEPSEVSEDNNLYLRPKRLEFWLESEIPKRIVKAGFLGNVNQSPEAHLVEKLNPAWLARMPATEANLIGHQQVRAALKPDKTRQSARRIVHSAIYGDTGPIEIELAAARTQGVEELRQLAQNVDLLMTPFGPPAFESQCGIKLLGARAIAAESARGCVQLLAPDVVRAEQVPHPGTNVLLRFDNGNGTVVATLPGFIASLRFDGEELIDVTYEPSANHPRWSDYKQRSAELRHLRAVVAAASRAGRFQLEGAAGQVLAQQMQFAKSIDPTLAVYAAYANHDLQATERIRYMADIQSQDLGMCWFDVALLARELIDTTFDVNQAVLPFAPMLAQGWPIVRAHRLQWSAPLAGLEATLKHSLWSLYDDQGVEIISRVIKSRRVI